MTVVNIDSEIGTYTIEDKNISFVYTSKDGNESYIVTNSGVRIKLTDSAAKKIADLLRYGK